MGRDFMSKDYRTIGQILGDDLEDSIIERINNAKELKDILDKPREQQLKAKEDYLNNEN